MLQELTLWVLIAGAMASVTGSTLDANERA